MEVLSTMFTTVALLVSCRRHGTAWRDYFNTIETALEAAAPASRGRASRPRS